MIVQIIIITLGFVIALSYPMGIEPLWFLPTDAHKALESGLAILLLSAGYILLGFWLVRRQLRNNLKHYFRQLFRYRLLLLGIYFIQLYVFHLPVLISGAPGCIGLNIGQIPFATNFLILTPFLLTLITSYVPFYKIERFICQQTINTNPSRIVIPAPHQARGELQQDGPRESGEIQASQESVDSRLRGNDTESGLYSAHSTSSLFNFLIFQIRTYFMLGALPILVFLFALEMLHAIPTLHNMIYLYPSLELLISFLLLFSMYLTAPFMLKYLWVTKPLPDGPLRENLKSLAGRANIKIRDFLIWEVGQRPFVNALLIGIFPFNRLVIFTDSIIKNLADDEITAVCAHEIGHAKFNHLVLLFLFSLAYLAILFSLSGTLEGVLGNGPGNLGFSLALIMFFWLVLFGQLSRRFELQADWFAVQITGDPDSFTRALTRIAYLNGTPLHTSGISTLTHPSIDQRIASIAHQSGFGDAQIRLMKRLIIILAASVILALVGVNYAIIREIESAPQKRLKIQTADQAEKGRQMLTKLEHTPYDKLTNEELKQIQTAINYITRAMAADPKEPYYRILFGDVLSYLGPNCAKASQDYYRKAYDLGPVDPGTRYYLERKLAGK